MSFSLAVHVIRMQRPHLELRLERERLARLAHAAMTGPKTPDSRPIENHSIQASEPQKGELTASLAGEFAEELKGSILETLRSELRDEKLGSSPKKVNEQATSKRKRRRLADLPKSLLFGKKKRKTRGGKSGSHIPLNDLEGFIDQLIQPKNKLEE